ncbi:MAG: carboxy-S-adenosyl-L-methionine synthase CmoA [Planctomycetota bacterium]
MRDEIYSLPRDQVGKFEFDDAVADVFPDMINRSVPGYGSILSVIEQLAERFVTPGSNVYDLGCSLGAATLLIRDKSPDDATIHAIDNSKAMTSRLQQRLDAEPAHAANVNVQQSDILDVTMENASFVVLNFTLQFIPAENRDALLQRVCDALNPGGALLLSEKVCFDAPAQQQLLADLHLDFKRANGYSELEIAQKRTSLENTLIPETIEAHCERLRTVGFEIVAPWFLCFNFASILAVKGDS